MRSSSSIGLSTSAGGSFAKMAIAEHGRNAARDRHAPVIVWGAGIKPRTVDERVETTQIAPTMLELLGLQADELEAVRKEDTDVLPGLRQSTPEPEMTARR
jgi:hypothetical protein